jgi:hypothetical protein
MYIDYTIDNKLNKNIILKYKKNNTDPFSIIALKKQKRK